MVKIAKEKNVTDAIANELKAVVGEFKQTWK